MCPICCVLQAFVELFSISMGGGVLIVILGGKGGDKPIRPVIIQVHCFNFRCSLQVLILDLISAFVLYLRTSL